jgi:methylphosphotriester-DNA--protein-cysteine methyltransferase
MRDIGLPPKTWMNLERMVVARRKLEGGETVEQVARDLGFMSVEAFRRKFHKVYKVSPARFLRGRRIFDPTNPEFPQPLPVPEIRRKRRKPASDEEE